MDTRTAHEIMEDEMAGGPLYALSPQPGARCAGKKGEKFFDAEPSSTVTKGEKRKALAEAMQECWVCPLLLPCRTFGVMEAKTTQGVLGGFTQGRRRELRTRAFLELGGAPTIKALKTWVAELTLEATHTDRSEI